MKYNGHRTGNCLQIIFVNPCETAFCSLVAPNSHLSINGYTHDKGDVKGWVMGWTSNRRPKTPNRSRSFLAQKSGVVQFRIYISGSVTKWTVNQPPLDAVSRPWVTCLLLTISRNIHFNVRVHLKKCGSLARSLVLLSNIVSTFHCATLKCEPSGTSRNRCHLKHTHDSANQKWIQVQTRGFRTKIAAI
jgi:hypothetical protein